MPHKVSGLLVYTCWIWRANAICQSKTILIIWCCRIPNCCWGAPLCARHDCLQDVTAWTLQKTVVGKHSLIVSDCLLSLRNRGQHFKRATHMFSFLFPRWPVWFGVFKPFLSGFFRTSQAVRLWAPRGFRPLTGRMRRSSTAWRSPSAISSTSSRTSIRRGSPSRPSWTWTLRSPWRRCQTVPSPRWRSCTRPPTLSPAHSTPLNRHQQPIRQGVSYGLCFILMEQITKGEIQFDSRLQMSFQV